MTDTSLNTITIPPTNVLFPKPTMCISPFNGEREREYYFYNIMKLKLIWVAKSTTLQNTMFQTSKCKANWEENKFMPLKSIGP